MATPTPPYDFDKHKRSYGVDPLRESGLLKNQSNNTMYAIALALPADYKQLRTQLEIDITHELVKLLYQTVFAALRDGHKPNGNGLVNLTNIPAQFKVGSLVGNFFNPNIPESEVNEIAYECATALIHLLQDKVVDRIMPVNLSSIANEKIAARTTMKIAAGEYTKK